MGEVVSWWKDWMLTLICAVQFVSVMLPAKALSIIWFWVKRKKRKSTIKNVYSNIYFCWRFNFSSWHIMSSKNAKWRGNKVIKPPPPFVVDYHIVPIFHFWKHVTNIKENSLFLNIYVPRHIYFLQTVFTWVDSSLVINYLQCYKWNFFQSWSSHTRRRPDKRI